MAKRKNKNEYIITEINKLLLDYHLINYKYPSTEHMFAVKIVD